MVKKIQINLSDKLYYTLLSFAIIILGVFLVNAYSGNVGHTSNQIDVNWSQISGIPTDIADGDQVGTTHPEVLTQATTGPSTIGDLLGYSRITIQGKDYAVPLYQIQELKSYSGVVRHGSTTLSAPCGYNKWQVLSVTRSPKPNQGAGSVYDANSGEKQIFYDTCDDDSYLFLNYNKDACTITHKARTDNDCGYGSADWAYQIKFFID